MRQIPWVAAAAVLAGGALMNVAIVDRTNQPVDPADTIEAQAQMPGNVAAILQRACRDCHSEKTHWPWYSSVAPMHWLMAADVYGGRDHLNLSRWGRYSAEERTERLIGICEMVAGNKMPLWYYKPIHPSAWLSEHDKKTVCEWVKSAVVEQSAARSSVDKQIHPGDAPQQMSDAIRRESLEESN
jgi:hypothetical protein